VAETGVVKLLVAQLDLHLAHVTGMTVADHLHFGSILSDLSHEDAEDLFEQVRQTVRRLTDR
jgi:NAD(P)H dehydrogenase (quinone)